MTFTKRLREGVREGRITCSVRIWTRPHVIVGNRYRMDEGEIEIDSIAPIGLPDITPEMARESGFLGVVDLLKVAKHGKGDRDLSDSISLHSSTEDARKSVEEQEKGEALASPFLCNKLQILRLPSRPQ
jgi:hypothetical protein